MSYSLDTIVAWAKRKGFVYPNSDIYGWLANAWDYGPYGALLRKNICDLWTKFYCQERDDVILMDTAIIAHPTTWVASGHVWGFADALIDDKKTGQRFRADKIIENELESRMKQIEKKKGEFSFYVISKQNTWAWEQYLNEWVDIIKKINPNALPIVSGDWCYLYSNCITTSINQIEEEFDCKLSLIGAQELENISYHNKRNWPRAILIYELEKEFWFINDSPEARGNDWMHTYILKHIPNNPDTKKPADRTECRNFNLMLNTTLGPVADEANKVYMRPETCQSLFTDFRNVCDTTRNRIPFGLAQIGKAFRNEITPGQFLFRTREFEQMEIEYFVPADPENAMKVFEEWKKVSMDFWTEIIGISNKNLRYKDHDKLAHYAAAATDIEFSFPRGFGEVQGIHNRTDFDLKQHQEHSQTSMQYTDPKTGQRYIPRCVETSMGVGRCMMASMLEFYDEEEVKEGDTRVVVRFPKQLAPIKFAIFPLMEKDEAMSELAREIYRFLKKSYICEYDGWGNIGKRYRRQDEIGTPYCITVDHQSLEDGTVTVRERDSMEQKRVKWEEIVL